MIKTYGKLLVPEGYESPLSLMESQRAIKKIKDYFQQELAYGLKLRRVSAPIFVDPKTGRSQASALLSVTVVASSCMLADAWATACMVLGTERVVQLMEGRDDLGVMTITAGPEGQLVVWSNARFARLVAQ